MLGFNIPQAEPKSVTPLTPVYMFVDPLPTEVAPCFSHVFRSKSVAEKYPMDKDKQKKHLNFSISPYNQPQTETPPDL